MKPYWKALNVGKCEPRGLLYKWGLVDSKRRPLYSLSLIEVVTEKIGI